VRRAFAQQMSRYVARAHARRARQRDRDVGEILTDAARLRERGRGRREHVGHAFGVGHVLVHEVNDLFG